MNRATGSETSEDDRQYGKATDSTVRRQVVRQGDR